MLEAETGKVKLVSNVGNSKCTLRLNDDPVGTVIGAYIAIY